MDKELTAAENKFKKQIASLEKEQSVLTGELKEMEKKTKDKENWRKDKV